MGRCRWVTVDLKVLAAFHLLILNILFLLKSTVHPDAVCQYGKKDSKNHSEEPTIALNEERQDSRIPSLFVIERDYNLSPDDSFATVSSSASSGTASSSTKTASSESADSISTFTSPTLPYYHDSPVQERSSFSIPTFQSQPTDSIAQMLEYMRACNSQEGPSPSFSNSFREQVREQSEDERNTYRKRERNAKEIATQRKQRSLVQTISRSLSQGNEGRGSSLYKKEAASASRAGRQRSKTSAVPPKEGLMSCLRSIENGGRGSKGDGRIASESFVCPSVSMYTRQGNANEPPPHQQGPPLPSPWPARQSDDVLASSPKKQTDTLSLMEYLKQREGAQWTSRFLQSEPDGSQLGAENDMQARISVPDQRSSVVTVPKTPYEASHTSLPTQLNLSNVLGIQQAPNQALVQAFQTAFILGMQQLGLAGQLQSAPISAMPATVLHNACNASQPPWQAENKTHQQSASTSASQRRAEKITNTRGAQSCLNCVEEEQELDRSTAILENLLYDINQQRPEEQDFSLDDFLAFVATTVESKADEGDASINTREDDKEREREKTKELEEHPGQENDKSQDVKGDRVEGTKTCDRIKKKVNRRRTISLSGQLSETRLTDIVGQEKGQEKHNDERQREVLRNDAVIEVVPARKSGVVDATEFNKKEPRKTSGHTKGMKQSALISNKETIVDKETSKLAERKRRRRESHNAVERRRRDHINERIAELASLLPESMLLDAIAASTGGGTTPHIDLSLFTRRPNEILNLTDTGDTLAVTTALEESQDDLERKADALEPVHSSSETLALAQSKPNKGIILSKSVDYIKHLHEFCSILRSKNKEMQKEIIKLKNAANQSRLPSTMKREIPADEDHAMNDATPPTTIAAWLDQVPEQMPTSTAA